MILELIDAHRKANVQQDNLPNENPALDRWTLVAVIEIGRKGWLNTVLAEFIGAPTGNCIKFNFDSAEEVLKVGDIFSLRPDEISLFDMRRMRSKSYKIKVLETNLGTDEM